ncbi:YodL domain-containing protein, partial [Hungatella effluvii]|uniref:YodL domain-containing protein n=1 Tax=Hungatella effluvii TaxID=1096246 RepID=UPI002A8139F5
RNTMLIHMQKPDASLVAGLTKWQSEFERTRKRGERGLKILAPKPYTTRKRVPKLDPDTGQPITSPDGRPVTEEQEVTVPNFIVVSVYDISQTEGKEVPDATMNILDGDVDRYDDFLSALKQSTPYSFALEEINTGANGYCNYTDRHIGIKEGMGQLQTVETSIHEVTHARLYEKNRKLPDKKQPDQATREVQAESVAFAVCQYFGLDTSGFSFGYIADWGTGRDMKELKASLETIRATANELINEIEFHFAELQKQREQTNQQEAPAPEQVKAQNEKAPEPEQPTFTIYQLKRGEELRDYRFEPYERLQDTGLSVNPANYEQIYTAPLEPGMTLGDIDVKFNLNHPADFTGHSLSVSDVVVLHQDGKDTAHYYDSIGFQDVPEFLQEREAVQEQEAVYQIGDNYLYIQTCESGYDYTLYDRTFQPGDSGQLDNPALTFEAAKDGIAALHGMSGLPCESVTPADFEKMQEAYNQQPTVTINFSENGELEQGDVLPYGLAERTFERLDREARAERDDPDRGHYYKTDFTVTYMMEGQLYEYN